MTTLFRRSVLVLTLAAVVGAATAARAREAPGPQKARYQEAVQAIKAGDYEEATERLDDVLALNPSSTDALELRNLTETEVIIQALAKGPEPLRKKMLGLLQLAAEAERQRLTDTGQIKGAIEDLLGGFEVRHKAYARLVSAGRHAVPLLVGKLLATSDPDYKKYRVRCTIALMRIGEEAVIPLCTALRTRSVSLRQDIAFALGEIGDPRAVPYLLRTAQSDPDPQVRAVAQEALAKTSKYVTIPDVPAHEAMVHYARLYYYDHPSIRRPASHGHAVWSWSRENQRLAMQVVPGFLYNVSMARQVATDALLTKPDYEPVLPLLISTYRQEVLRIDRRLELGDAAGQKLTEQMVRQLRARQATAKNVLLSLRSAGEKHFYRALGLQLHDDRPGLAAGIIEDLATVARPELNQYSELRALYESLRPAVYKTPELEKPGAAGTATRRVEKETEAGAGERSGGRATGALVDAWRLFASRLETEKEKTEEFARKKAGARSAAARSPGERATLRNLVEAARKQLATQQRRAAEERAKAEKERAVTRAESNPLIRALREPDKSVRYGAAAALVQIKPTRQFAASQAVVEILGQAITEKGRSTVLIITADDQAANTLRKISREAGHTSFSAATVTDALTAARSLPPKDVFVIDAAMNKVYGRIKEIPALTGVPVVIFTTGRETAVAEQKYGNAVAGVVSLFDKPEEIRSALARAIPGAAGKAEKSSLQYAATAADALMAIPKAGSPFSPHLARITEALEAALGSKQPAVRIAAIRTLGKAGAKSVIPRLISVYLEQGKALNERRACIMAIGDMIEPGETVPPAVLDLLAAVHKGGSKEMRELIVREIRGAPIPPGRLGSLITEQEAAGAEAPGAGSGASSSKTSGDSDEDESALPSF